MAGRRPVEEAFAARREARRLLVVPERRAALERIVLHATTLRIPVVEVAGGTITAVSGFDGHQGVALVVAPRRWATLDEVLALARARQESPFLLALDHLEDPQNVGTLLRSAEACGVHGVIFPSRGAAPISPAAGIRGQPSGTSSSPPPAERSGGGSRSSETSPSRSATRPAKRPAIRSARLEGPLCSTAPIPHALTTRRTFSSISGNRPDAGCRAANPCSESSMITEKSWIGRENSVVRDV